MKKTAVFALAALAALALPGCYFVTKTVPLDASGMEYPLHQFSLTLGDQVDRSGDWITGLPRRLSLHFRACWRNITQDPGKL